MPCLATPTLFPVPSRLEDRRAGQGSSNDKAKKPKLV